jgi:hypothetical protein
LDYARKAANLGRHIAANIGEAAGVVAQGLKQGKIARRLANQTISGFGGCESLSAFLMLMLDA